MKAPIEISIENLFSLKSAQTEQYLVPRPWRCDRKFKGLDCKHWIGTEKRNF